MPAGACTHLPFRVEHSSRNSDRELVLLYALLIYPPIDVHSLLRTAWADE